MKNTMYLCVGTAKPKQKNTGYIFGKDHALLIFASASSVEKANSLAIEHLESTGWTEVIIDKTNPVNTEALKNVQPEIKNAYELALKDGSHGMVLSENNA